MAQTQQELDIIAERKRGEEEGAKPEGRASLDIKSAPVKRLQPGQQPMVTMDMVKAKGFDNLRDYLNDQKGLKRRVDKTAEKPANKPAEKSYENMVKFDPARPSMQPLSSSQRRSDFKQRQADSYYAKGGKINLDACGVSTHKPAKKNPNF